MTITSTDVSSTFAFYTINRCHTAAAELDNPTQASSVLTSITKTGSVPGVTTETTASGIIVTQTIQPSKGMSSGSMAAMIVGAAGKSYDFLTRRDRVN